MHQSFEPPTPTPLHTQGMAAGKQEQSPHIHQLLFPWGWGEHLLSLFCRLIFRRLEVIQGRERADDFEPSENQANFFTDEQGIRYMLQSRLYYSDG